MFKRVKPQHLNEALSLPGAAIKAAGIDYARYPHCDQRVLHAPSECQYCDAFPERQALRQAWGICFTGYEPEGAELPCPADFARPGGLCEKWSGNKARTE